MTVSVERCDDCREYHHPGPCYPTDDQRGREDGWRLYKAAKTMTFKHPDPDLANDYAGPYTEVTE